MGKLVFYRQKRVDGGIRMGITTDKWPDLGLFEEGDEESDPVLNWFVDVRVTGKKLPKQSESARQWLLKHADPIREGLRSLAEELQAGLDFEWPLQWEMPGGPSDVQIQVVCSVKDRQVALAFSKVLKDIAKNWTTYLMSLKPEAARLEVNS
jgi:hypothetical protein